MSKNLYYTIVPFIKNNIINSCEKVLNIKEIKNDNFFIFTVNRYPPYSSFNILFSDSYIFTENNYYEVKPFLKKGDFILIARPEADFVKNLLNIIYSDGFYIGKTKFLVKFLNNDNLTINECIKKLIKENKEKNDTDL